MYTTYRFDVNHVTNVTIMGGRLTRVRWTWGTRITELVLYWSLIPAINSLVIYNYDLQIRVTLGYYIVGSCNIHPIV